MICNNCGAENNEGARFCIGCGAELNSAPAQPVYEENFYQAPEQEYPAQETTTSGGGFDFNSVKDGAVGAFNKATDFGKNYMEEAKTDKKKLFIGIGAAVVAIALIVVLIFAVGGKPYKKALQYELDFYTGKLTEKNYEKSMPDEYWEYLDDELDRSFSDSWKAKEKSMDAMVEFLEEEYGDNVKITYKIKEADKLSDKKLGDLKDYYKECGMEKKSLTKAYELELEINVKGSDDKETLDGEAVVFKYKNKWYVDYLTIDD